LNSAATILLVVFTPTYTPFSRSFAKKETTIFGRRLSFLFVFSLFSQIVVSGEKRRDIRFADDLNYIARARIHTQNVENIFFNRYAVESKTAVWYDLLNKLEFV